MGTLSGGDGDRPHEGQPKGLPGLPPEWGVIVVPDDPSPLAAESAQVRKELRQAARRERWRRRLGLSSPPGSSEPPIGLPLLIMGVAIMVTLTSLFAMAWPRQRPPMVAIGEPTQAPVPDVTLLDGRGMAVRLRSTVPAVVLLVEGCECGSLVAEVAKAAPPGVTVVPVDRSVPDPRAAPPAKQVRPLADQNGTLRRVWRLPSPSGTASVALLSRSGQVVTVLPTARRVDDFRPSLATLG